MITKESVEQLLKTRIDGTSIFPVEVEVKAGNLISVSIDTPEGIGIEECAEISRYLNEMLDREVEDYELEVASPGLGYPFRVPEQYQKNLQKEVEVVFRNGKKIKGTLTAFNEKGISLKHLKSIKTAGAKRPKKTETEEFFQFEEIKATKSVVSFK